MSVLAVVGGAAILVAVIVLAFPAQSGRALARLMNRIALR